MTQSTAATPRTSVTRASRGGANRRLLRDALLMLAPALAALVAFRLLPFASAVEWSTQHVRLGIVTEPFVGPENYVRVLQSPAFQNSLRVTLFFALVVNPLQILSSLALATLFVQRIRGIGILRTLIFLPVVVPPAVASLVWGVALRPDGITNEVLQSMGVPAQGFLTSPDQALLCIVALVSWMGLGYWTIFLIAGLKDIPPQLVEAAAIDGAGWWRTYRSVTLPLMLRPLAFVLVADTVANFLLFAPVQILTHGGPQGSTDLIMYEIYQQAYAYGNPNVAFPEAVLLMLTITLIMVIQFAILRRAAR